MTPLAYIKLGLAAVVLIALGWLALIVNGWRQDSLRVEEVETELSTLKAAQEASQKASEGYQNELEAIRNRPVPASPVRLCKPARVPPAGGRPSPTVPPADVVSGTDGTDPEVRGGPDIGPALRSLAKRADEVSAQGRATQSLHLKGPR